MKVLKQRKFANGVVYALETDGGYPVEVTDTFLPYYTKDAIGRRQNTLQDYELGDRSQRWMIGVSCMSGCPVGCKFCATGKLKKFRCLSADEIVRQVTFVLARNDADPCNAREFKVNYTRMGEPFLNLSSVRRAIGTLDYMTERGLLPHVHHYVSTIGLRGSDFSWIRGNVTLQVSLHSLDEAKRDWLIPHKNKMSVEELGRIRTASDLKTTINLTLVDESDWDADKLADHFDPDHFFVKISPINENDISRENDMGAGVITAVNLA